LLSCRRGFLHCFPFFPLTRPHRTRSFSVSAFPGWMPPPYPDG
jgi:hypothetical protein